MTAAYVHGLGLWTPGYPDSMAWCRGVQDPEVWEPKAALLQGPNRRRASALTRMAAEALQQAATEAGCDLATAQTVWATAHADHEIAVAILRMMQRGEGKLSPTKFHNSVYNAASGHASIATGNRAPSTTLAGGPELAAMCLLEALCCLQAGTPEVIAVLFDQPMLPPFNARGALAPLALAFGLSLDPEGAKARLSDPRRDAVAPVKRHERFGGLYVSAALPLLERILLGRPGCVPLEFESEGEGAVWCLDLELLEASPAATVFA